MRGEITLAVLSLATVAAITITPPAGTLRGLKRSLLPRTLQDKSAMDGRYEPRAADRRNVPSALAGKYKLTADAVRYEPRAEAKRFRPQERGGQWALLLRAASEIYKALSKRKAWAVVGRYKPGAVAGRYKPRAINNAARLASLVAGNKQSFKAVAGKGTVFSSTLSGSFPSLVKWSLE